LAGENQTKRGVLNTLKAVFVTYSDDVEKIGFVMGDEHRIFFIKTCEALPPESNKYAFIISNLLYICKLVYPQGNVCAA
jgi:hypothetical protein